MNKKMRDLPEPQGLYDPSYEHDACGIGIVANIKGIKSYCNQERQNKKGWEDVTLGNSRAERPDTCRES